MTIEQKIILASVYQLIKNKKKSEFDLKNLYDSYKKIKKETNNTLLSLNEFREVLLNFKEMGIVNVSNSKKSLKENNYKVKYSEDELSMIMAEPDIFKLFKTDDYLE
jgi:Cdc6-like AAA superfamily ATPase